MAFCTTIPFYSCGPDLARALYGSGRQKIPTPNAPGLTRIPGNPRIKNSWGSLLDEKTFAKLIAANKSLGGTKPPEQVGNFAILVNTLRSEWAGGGNQLEVLRVQNAIPMKCFRLASVKDRQGDSAIANERGDPRDQPRHQVAIEVIQQVQAQHGVECFFRITQGGLKKPLRARRRRHFQTGRAGRQLAPLFLLRIQKILPCHQQVFGVNLKAALDEESDRCLSSGPQVQQMAATDSIQLPKESFQPISKPRYTADKPRPALPHIHPPS